MQTFRARTEPQPYRPPAGAEVRSHAGTEVGTYFLPAFAQAACSGTARLSPSDTPSIAPAGLLSCDKTFKYHCPRTFHVDNRGRPRFAGPSRGALKKAPPPPHPERRVLKNKHAAVPKPFHILKRRQTTNL